MTLIRHCTSSSHIKPNQEAVETHNVIRQKFNNLFSIHDTNIRLICDHFRTFQPWQKYLEGYVEPVREQLLPGHPGHQGHGQQGGQLHTLVSGAFQKICVYYYCV